MSAHVPENLKRNAEDYIALTSDTVGSLRFLLDNLGESIDLDSSPSSVEKLESLLRRLHEQKDPDGVFPDVLEILSQLLAQYGALVLEAATGASWAVESRRSSAYFGQPFIDVVPGDDQHRFYPLHLQIALREPRVVLGRHYRLARQIESGLKARSRYDELCRKVRDLLGEAPGGKLSESEIIDHLQRNGVAPDPAVFSVAAKQFPKRVGQMLRKSDQFKQNRRDKKWSVRAQRAT